MYLDSWTEIETYKDLNLAALRQGSTTCLYIYYLLRVYDGIGKSYIEYDKFVEFLTTNGIKREQIYTAFKNPHCSIYFYSYEDKKKNKFIRYSSLEKVCKALDTIPGISVHLAIPDIRTFKRFNAYIYSTLFRTKNPNHKVSLSREKITELTGLSTPTQITYEKIAGIEVTPTIACYVVPDNMRHIPMETIINSLPCADMHHTVSKNRISWQRANKYYSPNVRVYKGRNHRVNRLIRNQGERAESYDQRKRAKSPREYYQNVTTRYFTDQRTSYINAHFNIPIYYGKQAQVYRYNLLAPTNNPEEAVPGAYLNENKFIVIGKVYAIPEETI
jgi:hypothetical protein